MSYEKLADLLRCEIEGILSNLKESAGLLSLAREPLEKKQRGLYSNINHNYPWALLPAIVAETICGNGEISLPAAASFQFLFAAGDVFDDIEDADSPDSIYKKYGLPVAVSVATTLLILGEQSLTRLKLRGVNADTIVHVANSINSFYTSACIGQHLDLTTELLLSASEEVYLKIITMKSAIQIEGACYIGALLAGANGEVIDKFASFGHNLGIASQISNDIQGSIIGKDIIKHKTTLPVIYCLNSSDETIRNKMKSLYQKQSFSTLDTKEVKDILFRSGAIHYSTLKMELYKQKVQDILSEIQKIGINVENLKVFCR